MFSKKEIRAKFRQNALIRDKLSCRMCEFKTKSLSEAEELLDVHHIQNRKLMPNGGYVLDNAISLCQGCHIKAETFHSTGTAYPGYSVEDLFKIIGSSLEKAIENSKKLKV